ncbi:DNA primase [bacterium]|jgi:DNA primase|nr:DNA primase [bacterium]MBT4250758.1 DNA primase [bacterium]MBT4598159.1 DNA primase [bacterium]MBT6753757.1 DNA primase [bacterium]MBT7037530.1 DNA primase [bacterium]
MDAKEQVKENLTVADLVGEYVKLDKAGINHKALCPFHNEKTPSFMVNTERNFWYCFGCQRGGDIFSFLMEIEGLDFHQALIRLAEKTNIELPKFQGKVSVENRTKKQKASEILEISTKVYSKYLKHPEIGKVIREYLKKRKIDKQLISDFRIGYAPNEWRKILKYLRNKGYSITEIADTGLSVPKESGEDYDRFRDRIMFPVINETGIVVGYSARVAPGGDEKSAKYINTPQSLVYDKSRVLYGLYQGKAAIRKEDSVVVVEGNVDVIASHYAEVKNVVAISGTALSVEQVRILKRYTQNVKLCLDADEAGRKATSRSIQTCLQEGMEVEVILLPKGIKDIGDLVIDEAKNWKNISKKTIPVIKYFFEESFAKNDSNDVRGKKNIAKELLNIIKDIADPIEQSYWIKKLSLKIDIEEEVLTNVLEKVSLKKDIVGSSRIEQLSQENTTERSNKPKGAVLEERLLGLFALFSEELSGEVKIFNTELLSEENQKIFQKLKTKDVDDELNQQLNKSALRIKYSHDKVQGFIENEIDPKIEWNNVISNLETESIDRKMNLIKKDIQKAEELDDDASAEILQQEWTILAERRQKLKGF